MTEIIIGERRSGKTTELIKMSAETGAYIVVGSGPQRDAVKEQAKRMGYEIPDVLRVSQFTNQDIRTRYADINMKGILIDEIGMLFEFLRCFVGIPIKAVTLTDHVDINVRRLEKPKIDIYKVNDAVRTLKEACRQFSTCSEGCPFYIPVSHSCRLGGSPMDMEVIE